MCLLHRDCEVLWELLPDLLLLVLDEPHDLRRRAGPLVDGLERLSHGPHGDIGHGEGLSDGLGVGLEAPGRHENRLSDQTPMARKPRE